MLPHRKITRDFLLATDRPTFLEVIYRAKVSPRQKEIIILKLLDRKDYGFISCKVFVTEEMVKKDIEIAYDLIYNYLLNTNLLPK